MSTFDDIRNNLAILGVLAIPIRALPSKLLAHKSIMDGAYTTIIAFWLICYCVSMWCFVSFKAQTIDDYLEGLLFCTISTVRLVLYLTVILNKFDLSLLMDDLEKIIESSKFYESALVKLAVPKMMIIQCR